MKYNHLKNKRHARSAGDRVRAGFTLVEMLVAVAAVGIIAVGLGRLFQRTGDTVKRGRQISRLNEAATVLERTMREDFSRMSPEGFLVIKNVLTPNDTKLAKDDQTPEDYSPPRSDLPRPRQRRIDQVVFFREGRFVSKAIPKDPNDYAVGTAARIYYGHGHPVGTDVQASVTDTNASNSLGTYASNWILMRHETVLCPPRLTQKHPAAFESKSDNRTQIAQNPAAVDVFGIIAKNYKVDGLPSHDTTNRVHPLFSSGIVDVAATDLSLVRARVLNAQPLDVEHLENVKFELEDILPEQPNPYGKERELNSNGGRLSFVLQDPLHIDDQNNPGLQAQRVPTAARMKGIMIQALPGDEPSELESDYRMRCEPHPPAGASAGWNERMMLSASNLVVGCTEFIVEWSYGVRYPSHQKDSSDIRTANVNESLKGQLIWHGLPRLADINGNALPGEGPARDEYVAHPYNSVEPSMRITGGLITQPVQPLQTQEFLGVESTEPIFARIGGDRLTRHIFQTPLIHEPLDPSWRNWRFPEWTNWDFESNRVLCSCFGYVDPTFGYGITGLPVESAPVPRPKLIRVTVGLVDPSDPLNEQRFQFIFELPDVRDVSTGS